MSKLILLMCPDKFDINQLPHNLHHLARDAASHELVEVLFKVTGSLFPGLSVNPDVRVHPGVLLSPESTVKPFQKLAK